MPQLVDRALPQAAVLPECLDGDIDADLVSELEAVHDGACWAGHAHRHAFDVVLFDSGRQGRSRHANDPNRTDIEPRDGRASIDGQPDFTRVLRPERVEAQSRQQADDALGHALRDFRERVELTRCGGSGGVQAASQAREMPLTGQPANLLGVQPKCLGFPKAEHACDRERT